MKTKPTITNEQINSLPLLVGIMEDMAIRATIDDHITPHGHWEGASIGTLVTIWLAHMLMERSHVLSHVREWANDRTASINALLGISMRDTDCTDDRLANVLTMLGNSEVQEALDEAFLQRWIRVYRLPTKTVRLDSTSVSVYHDPDDPDTMLLHGHSKDHRPDLRQFKLMLSALDPMSMPVCVQTIAGNRADDGLYLPAYQRTVAVLGTTDVVVVGDSKMARLATRAAIVRGNSTYICPYRPATMTGDMRDWLDTALAQPDAWEWIPSVDPSSGIERPDTAISTLERDQTWNDPDTGLPVTWTERVLVVRREATRAAQQTARLRALEKLTDALEKLRLPPGRGRKAYRQQCDLDAVVQTLLNKSGWQDVVSVTLTAEVLPSGNTRWIVDSIAVDAVGWQAMSDRLGWQFYLTNTTAAHYSPCEVVGVYRHQPVEERGFSRLKTRNLHIRPLYLRDEHRIAGLVWLMTLALRLLTLTEYRVRDALEQRNEDIVGLTPGSRTQSTRRPTSERMFRVFNHMTLTIVEMAGEHWYSVTALNETQRHILSLLNLSPALYEGLEASVSNLVGHLRE
jgi:transposase